MDRFTNWLREARAGSLPEPNAMSLATAWVGGWPSARTVLLRTVLFLSSLVLALASSGGPAAAAPGLREIPPAFGPHVRPTEKEFAGATTFRTNDHIVGTYYFYWYDAPSKAHLIDHDGTDALTTHPPTLEGLSWNSVTWHRRQLEDMTAAGIDVVLPVFWGAPSEREAKASLHWSYAGIPKLVEARDALLKDGKQPPRIGMFYDTSTLQHNSWGEHQDLTTERGRRWFYATVRDFFSMVPPKHWAMIEGRPIVLLYSASFARQHDQGAVDFLRAEFPKEFAGRVPWLVREVSWQVQADGTVAWGGALGLKKQSVASLGPGYDHSAVPGRAPLVVDRRGGRFYEEQWLQLLRRPSHFVMVETWNEWHEGTDVAESKEYGRHFIELTRKYAELFKQGWRPPQTKGPFTDARSVRIALGPTNEEHGLRQVENEDGVTAPTAREGRGGRELRSGKTSGRYLYFVVDDSFKPEDSADLTLAVEFFDPVPGTLRVEFDGSDPAAPFSGAYTRSPDAVKLTGGRAWRTASFRLPQARLLNGQNRNADLRLVVEAAEFVAAQVTLSR